MFTRKETPLRVISVKSEKRNFKEVREAHDYGRVAHSERKEYSHYVTTVLVVKDGEMYTKEFNGKWDMEDVKEWENA